MYRVAWFPFCVKNQRIVETREQVELIRDLLMQILDTDTCIEEDEVTWNLCEQEWAT